MARLRDARASRTRFACARASMCWGAETTVEAADIVTPSERSRVFLGFRPWLSPAPAGWIGRNEHLSRFGGLLPRGASGVRRKLSQRAGGRQLRTRLRHPSRSLRASFSCSVSPCPKMDKEKLPIAGEIGELLDHLGEDLQRPIEVVALVGRHQAGAEERAAGRDRGVKRDVGVHAGLEQRLPEKR